ncbi:MAG: hypothetical protein PHP54_00065 [Clostridia bacterium]|nr:hypothetical protein [Clostridia bacterium]
MKNKILLIITILFMITAILSGVLYFIDHNKMKNNQPVIFSTWGKKYEPSIKEDIPEISNIDIPKEPEYIDENPVKIGIYVEKGNQKQKITDYTCAWYPETVMGLFYVIPTEDDFVSNYNFDTLWKHYISQYTNPEKYRIGYTINFTLNNGEEFNKTILNPDDAFYMFPKVMCFLYDDVNLVPGKRYYHITSDVMYDYTLCSSIKLVGDVETKNIISDITLTAFCFDTDDDFDTKTGNYRGNSSYTITIKKK